MGHNTSVYLTELQYERLQAMAQADNRSASNLIATLLDQAWHEYQERGQAPNLSRVRVTSERAMCAN